ncbi:MAG: two-component system response regulator KdpE [Immundisolibacter sp.]|nr:two-component system response regulator KdpE [Immundisolibacter sp.]MDD3651239.1 two-component system response regulator KdpE [Immundisolibacter sp.]
MRRTLEDAGLKVAEAATLARGLIEAGTRRPDLVILDLGLPDGDGRDFITALRAWSRVPVIVLSARAQEADKVAALDAGADDYLTKPFGVAELLARVRVALRHGRSGAGGGPMVRLGAVTVDLVARRVQRGDEDIHLTAVEFRLLTALLKAPGRVLTHRHLLREVWGPNSSEHGHYLRIYMARLRHKLEADPARPRYLLTETGIGYRYAPETSDRE